MNSRINEALVRVNKLEALLSPREYSQRDGSSFKKSNLKPETIKPGREKHQYNHARFKRETSISAENLDVATLYTRLQTLESSLSTNRTETKNACLRGPPGLPGRDGLTGLTGPAGNVGSQGRDGRPGSSGRDGIPGRDALPGRDGQAGRPGVPGRNGATGPKGERGDMGPLGYQGPKGEKGRRGKRGERGPSGTRHIGPQTPGSGIKTPIPTARGGRRFRGKADGAGGAVYTRWGRADCPGTGVTLVYEGRTAGSSTKGTGSGSNYLCMPLQPFYARAPNRSKPRARLYGVEYGQVDDVFLRVPGRPRDMSYQGIPCAVCRTPSRPSLLMIPARYVCPSKTWTREYHGYLMSPSNNSTRAEYICVDADAGVVRRPTGASPQRASLLTSVQGKCGALPCPPYRQDWELTCAVCTA